jgi:DNA polymerase III sliding clamp (beta) subunit (PCNA family)
MNIKVKPLKSFFQLSSGISVNNIIPILGYIKLDNGELIKSNLQTFIQHKVDIPNNISVLLDEKVMGAFLKDCKSEEIEFKVEQKVVNKEKRSEVWLIDGKRKIKFQSPDISDYPKFPDSEKENEITLDDEVLGAIGRASKNVGAVGANEVLDFIHLSNGYVIGTDRAKFYCKKILGIPSVVIDTETANTISQFSEVNFYQKGKYNFFNTGNTVYAFIQPEVKSPDLMPFIPKEQPKEVIEFEVAELVGFCDTVVAASASKVLNCALKGNKLSFKDADYDIDYDMELNSTGTFEPNITFLPRTFGGYFKSLGYQKIKLAQATINSAALSVWSDEDISFAGLVIGTVPPTAK